MQVLIRVTANDIKHGKIRDCENCAISRAVLRRLKKDFKPQTHSNGGITIHWRRGHHVNFWNEKVDDLVKIHEFDGDARRRRFISEFDNGGKPVPFEFKLEFPDHLGWVLAK